MSSSSRDHSELKQRNSAIKGVRWAFIGLVTAPIILFHINWGSWGQWPLLWSILSIALVAILAAIWLDPNETRSTYLSNQSAAKFERPP